MKRYMGFMLKLFFIIFVLFSGIVTLSGQFQKKSTARGPMKDEILSAHNKYRSELKLPPLAWSDTLAAHAQEWANHLAGLGGHRLVHSSSTKQPGEGENLWLGTSGHFSYMQMVDSWGGEKKYFVYGTFPRVSSSGKWADVGHYTQMIWRDTLEVGCAVATAGGNDILVCRYSPPGNYIGQKVY